MSQSLAVMALVVPGRAFLFPGVIGIIHIVASLAVHTLYSPLKDFLGLGNDATFLVPLICSDPAHCCTGQSTWAKLNCGPPPCLFCLDKLNRFFKSQLFCLGQNLFPYLDKVQFMELSSTDDKTKNSTHGRIIS